MQLQFFTKRTFQVPASKVKKIIKGATKNDKGTLVLIGNRAVVDFEDAEGLKMAKMYPKEVEAWGESAIKKIPVVKAKAGGNKAQNVAKEVVEPQHEIV